MTALACISATLLAICIWWTDRLYERTLDKKDRKPDLILKAEDEPEFKQHELN